MGEKNEMTTDVSETTTKKPVKLQILHLLWGLGIVVILLGFGRGEDSYAERMQALEKSSPNCIQMTCRTEAHEVLPVKRLTRRGPRTEMLTHTSYQYEYQGKSHRGYALGELPLQTELPVWLNQNDPSQSSLTEPSQEIDSLRRNHYGTMMISWVFFISFFSFFMFCLRLRMLESLNGEGLQSSSANPPQPRR